MKIRWSLSAPARPVRFILAFALAASVGRAAVPLGDTNVQIGGFFSQGYLYSADNNYPTADKGGTWDFREMAFNASTTIGAHLRVGGQVFAQRFGALGDDKVILDWAVADYNFSPLFGIRAGRVKYPKGLYGEALDLDVVRPFIFLPGSVYSPILRDFSASFDGGMIYGTLNAGKSSLDYKAFYGHIPMSPEKGVAEFYNNAGFYTAPGVTALHMDAVAGGQLAWNTPVSGLKFVYSYSYYTNLSSDGPFAAYAAVDLHSNFDKFAWNTISAEYTWKDWVFAAEWQRSKGTIRYSAAPVLPLVTGDSGWDGWYAAVSRRLNERCELGAYFSDLENNSTSVPRSNPSAHQYDTALSLRFDLSEHVLFKLEAPSLDGTYQTFNTVRIPNPSSSLKDHTTIFAAKTTLSF
jgi:hypothetical protein